ncbi:MAG: DUF945 family protein [Legionellales bacterium]|nr:DUF945 family protein [Legionellales bacterium]
MRKTWVGVIALLAIIIGLAPVGMGYWSKKDIDGLIAAISKNQPVILTEKNYHMGWMHSSFTLEKLPVNPSIFPKSLLGIFYELDDKGNIVKPRFTTEVTIQHGPILFSINEKTQKFEWHLGRGLINTCVKFDPATQALLTQYLGAVPLIEGHGFITLAGNFKNYIQIGPLKTTDKKLPYQFESQGVSYHYNTNKSLTQFNFLLKVLPVKLISQDLNLSMDNFSIENHSSKRNPFKVWTGKNSVEINKLNFQHLALTDAAEQVTIENTQGLQGDKLTNKMTINAKNITIDNVNYPTFAFDINANQLDAASFAKFKDALVSYNKNFDASFREREAQQMAMIPLALNLIKQGGEIHLNQLQLTSADGNLTVTGELSLAKIDGENTSFFAALRSLLENTKANLSLDVSEKLLTNDLSKTWTADNNPSQATENPVNAKITDLINKGILVKQGDDLKMVAVYEKGKLMVNGKIIPTPHF